MEVNTHVPLNNKQTQTFLVSKNTPKTQTWTDYEPLPRTLLYEQMEVKSYYKLLHNLEWLNG